MGWTYCHRERGISHADFFDGEWGEGRQVLAASSVGTTVYIALQTPEGVLGVVCLTQRCPRSRLNFGYKVVSEDMGPTEAKCPTKILDMLTDYPLTGLSLKWSQQWRARCRAYNTAKASRPALTRVAIKKATHD